MAYLHTPYNHTDKPTDLPLKQNIWFSFKAEVYDMKTVCLKLENQKGSLCVATPVKYIFFQNRKEFFFNFQSNCIETF